VAIVVGMESLGEDLLLLSIRPDRGRIGNTDKIDFGLMGAELVRLAVLGRAEVAGERIAVVDAAPTGDAELDAALKSLAEAGRPPKATAWVGKPRRGIRGAYLARLAQAGVIQIEPTRFLGMPTGSRLHLIDGARVDAAESSLAWQKLAPRGARLRARLRFGDRDSIVARARVEERLERAA